MEIGVPAKISNNKLSLLCLAEDDKVPPALLFTVWFQSVICLNLLNVIGHCVTIYFYYYSKSLILCLGQT